MAVTGMVIVIVDIPVVFVAELAHVGAPDIEDPVAPPVEATVALDPSPVALARPTLPADASEVPTAEFHPLELAHPGSQGVGM